MATGVTILLISEQEPILEIITVPGASTSPSEYFCFMDRESFPVGILIPKAIANLEQPETASYKRASSPGLLQGHIQFAESDTLAKPFSSGAQTRLVNASPMAFILPFTGSIKPLTGACPIAVATPFLPLKSKAMTPQLLKGSCNTPTHCCWATRPVTHRSTLLVSQSLHATASN